MFAILFYLFVSYLDLFQFCISKLNFVPESLAFMFQAGPALGRAPNANG